MRNDMGPVGRIHILNFGNIVKMYLKVILLFGSYISTRGNEELGTRDCVTKTVSNCSQYKVCIEDTDNHVYPGRATTLVHDVFIPGGLTINASTFITSSTDRSVLIAGAYLSSRDDSLTMADEQYIPLVTATPGIHGFVSVQAIYRFGDIRCNGSREFIDAGTDTAVISVDATDSTDSRDCTFCLVQLAVEYIMADTTGVSENSTRNVTAKLFSENATIEVKTSLVLRPLHNTSTTPSFSTNIADVEELPSGSGKSFQLKALFSNPLSAYKLVLTSPISLLRIAFVRIVSVGDHYKDIIATTTGREDKRICSPGPDTRIIDFGYLPNKGTNDDNAPSTADIIEFEVLVLLSKLAIAGETCPLHIDLEVDFVKIMKSTKYFNATPEVPVDKIDINITQTSLVLPKSGTGSTKLTLNIPPFSNIAYWITASTKRYAGTGGDGLMVGGIDMDNVGSNMPCIDPSKHWKSDKSALGVLNVPYNTDINANKLSFKVWVIALPDKVDTYSSHELAVILSYPGIGSPQILNSYFNISNNEIHTKPNRNGKLPLNIYLNANCPSITPSTNVHLILHTNFGRQYGRVFVEFPVPTGTSAQSFALCSFGDIQRGHNIVGPHHTIITRGSEGLIEKVLVDISPLTNIYFASYDKLTVNYVTMKMVVTFIENSLHIDNLSSNFIARVISNNISIWTGTLQLTKPAIEHYPDFIVLREVVKTTDENPKNLSLFSSQNGSVYTLDALVWKGGSNVYRLDPPRVIAFYYFLTDPCNVICNITTTWQPLEDFVKIAKDDKKKMLRLLPYALDQDLHTCFDLPVPEDSPSMLWLRMINLSFFDVTSKRFVVHITGDDIECSRVGQKNLQVGTSAPSYNEQCSFESDLVFCKLLSHNSTASKTQCDIQCECDTLMKCSNVHIVLQSDINTAWRLCELTIEDAV